jgi:transposase
MQEQIKRLLGEGHSIRKVSQALGVSRKTVRKTGQRAAEVRPQQVEGASVALSAPQAEAEELAPWERLIDWPAARAAVTSGATIKQVHAEQAPEVSYTRFRRTLHLRATPPPATALRLNHLPGEKAQVDYCDGISIVNAKTGEAPKSQFFCGVLPFSSYTFGEFANDQKLPTFIDSHERMWSYFGGVTQYVVVDNLKSGVKRAHRYDPDVNPTYCDYGNHQGFAVLPARPYTPRDKACVEATIGAIQRSFFQEMRGRVFYSLSDLNAEFRIYLERFNASTMKDYGQSRQERFLAERTRLHPMAPAGFEIAEWSSSKVHPDCHIQLDKNFYSVPYLAVGSTVRVRKTQRLVEVFDGNHERLAAHGRLSGVGQLSTDERHYPEEKASLARFDVCMALREAERSGPQMQKVIHQLVHGNHPLRYLRRVQGILRLQKSPQITNEALEYGAGMALKFRKLRLGYVKSCADHYAVNGTRPVGLSPNRERGEVFLHGKRGDA